MHYSLGSKRKREDKWDETAKEIAMVEVVTAGDLNWERVGVIVDDSRQAPHFDTTFRTNLFHNEATEADIFRAFMPLSRATLLNIVRENADEDGDKRIWLGWHIDATLAIIFGGAQFKEGTDLWATKRVGMMPPPDFGRQLSHDRFQRVLRYWARGLPEEREKVKQNPWAQIDP